MRLLDRYLLRELLLPFAYCFCGFLIFWISFEFTGDLEDFQRNHLLARDIAEFYLVKTPKMLVDIVLPVSLLLGLLYTLTNHTRHNEFTAMRAAGVSLWRVCAPYLVVGVILTAASYVMNERLAPASLERAEEIMRRRQADPQALASRQWFRQLNLRNARDARRWSIGAFNLKTYELRRVDVEWTMPDGTQRTLLAESAIWTNAQWHFLQAQEFTRSATNPEAFKIVTNLLVRPELTETPAQMRSEIKISTRGSFKEAKRLQLSIRDLRAYEALHPAMEARDRDWLHTKLYERTATPFTCLVVVLIAIPFGTPSGRRNVFVGVAASIFIAFGFFVLKEFSLAAGTGGHLPPWLAAWLPNLIFGGLGITLISRVR